MKLLHEQSSQCLHSELDLFSQPPTQSAVDVSQWVDHSPMSTIISSSPIEFIVSRSDEYYMELNNTLLEVKTCIPITNHSPVVAMSVSFCLPHPVAVSDFMICRGLAPLVHRHLFLDHTLLLYHIASPRTPSANYIQYTLLFLQFNRYPRA